MIYFIQDEDTLAIKIGYGSSPADRIKTLQTGNPSRLHLLATIPGTQVDEHELHRRFASSRVAGEWFRPTPALLRLIATPVVAEPDLSPQRPLWYFAGKMSFPCWRATIMLDPDSVLLEEDVKLEQLPVRQGVVRGGFDYCGPYHYAEFNHGFFHPPEFADDTHSAFCPSAEDHQRVSRLSLDAIRRCSHLFAWIDSLDCYGTLAEIGYARALGKQIVIAGPRRYRDLWFVYEMADRVIFASGDDDPDPPDVVFYNLVHDHIITRP